MREVINMVLYQLDIDVAWYRRRLAPRKATSDGRNQVLRRIIDAKARMLAPLSPHVAEEMWSSLGNKGLVVRASWPAIDAEFNDEAAE
ncbi:class I tRNA ligase family protein, partial [Salmonella sp. SAL04286]|uniref:class I tRNA ligase family protein n=1 Tax=Salmonella sp. SAL04286 TaxID=3159864 RepID=UPI00397B78C1